MEEKSACIYDITSIFSNCKLKLNNSSNWYFINTVLKDILCSAQSSFTVRKML